MVLLQKILRVTRTPYIFGNAPAPPTPQPQGPELANDLIVNFAIEICIFELLLFKYFDNECS